MAAPSLSKTYQHTYSGGNSTNVRLVSGGGTALADFQTVMKRIKDILIGFSTNPWTTRYSCDGTTAGTAGDAVDRWTTIAKLVWNSAGSAHSWYVLRQTGIGSTFEICIDLSDTSASSATIVASPSAGFTGGTTTARPTATDEFKILNDSLWLGPGLANITGVLSVMMSTDGQVTFLTWWRAGLMEGMWVLAKPANAVSGWSTPFFGLVNAVSGAAAATVARLFTNGSPLGTVRIGTTLGACNMDTEAYSSSTTTIVGRIPTLQDAASPQEYVATPIGLQVPSTVGARGRHGTIPDLFAVPTSFRAGDTFPNDSTRTMAIIGILMLPWNGESVRTN